MASPPTAEDNFAEPTRVFSDAGNQSNAVREPSHEDISKLAHSYWLERKPDAGTAEADWLRAETELRNRIEPDE